MFTKISIKIKDDPAESPGTWNESKIIIKVSGSKNSIHRLHNAVTSVIAEEAPNE